MKRFLLATDLSSRSDRALERAVRLARQFHGTLIVVHALDEKPGTDRVEARRDAAEQQLHEHVTAVYRQAGAQPDGLEILVTAGRPFVEIERAAREARADLVITGMGREDLWSRMFLGSTVERLLRLGTTPVLVVKRRSAEAYWRVLVAMDFSTAARRALGTSLRLVDGGGEFHLFHAAQAPTPSDRDAGMAKASVAAAEERLEQLLAAQPIDNSEVKRIVRCGEPASTLLTEIERLNPDLVVLGTHGRAGIERLLLGSVAQRIIAEAPCDVLAAGTAPVPLEQQDG